MAAREVNKEEFEKLLTAQKAVLVDYWAPWCSYCRRLAPAYERIAEDHGELEVVKINIDDEPGLAQAQNIDVIPTLILYRDGKALGSVVAPDSVAAMERFIEETLSK